RENITENPLIWNGASKGHTFFTGSISYQPDPGASFSAYAYPNPASRGEVRIRVLNADDTIKLKIFDIAGNLVYDCQIANEPAAEQDIRWDTSAIASGMYFGIVKSAGKTVRVPIAIEY
ncbi:MAG: T9SS type A sorting domain-containing protein, partial [Candidatus Cloacimonetes bacterium]|nr:T9SS type A sorting domain-containing protein [Candidatus Cloacimonadota bacterium]